MPPLMREIFWFINRYFMVPMFRLGFGAFFGKPFTGYNMVMKPVGRKTGRVRFAPVNYAIQSGCVYCMSGSRESSDWFRNICANPQLELILPGGAIYARAEEVSDPDEKLVIARRQDAPAVYDMATVCYGANPAFVMCHYATFEGRVKAVHVPPGRAIDIDNLLEFQIAESPVNLGVQNR